jgi:hypothetical protein
MPSPNGKRPSFGQVRERRPASRWLSPGELAASHVIEWDVVIPDALTGCISSVLEAGAAIMFGLSQDGGVLRVQLYDGDDRPKWYVHDADDLNQLLRRLAELAHGDPPADVPAK